MNQDFSTCQLSSHGVLDSCIFGFNLYCLDLAITNLKEYNRLNKNNHITTLTFVLYNHRHWII